MKILQIELFKYKRMALNNITTFKMVITEPLQLILGTNGCGKSALLRQLTPLPPDQKEFSKDGFKKIIIEHNTSNYELISTFSNGQKHTFIKDGIKLNDEGTITVQRDLVKEHFGITNEIHNLIIGKELFDRMSPNRRKEWFLTLCETNYDYAISVYNKLRERLRDTTGALKLAKKRLSIESEKLIKDDEEKRLTDEVNELHKVLNHLLEYRKPLEDDLDILSINQKDKDIQLIKVTNDLEKILHLIKDEIIPIEGLESLIKTCELELYLLGNKISSITETFNQNNVKINILRKAEQNTISTLTKELQDIKNSGEKITAGLINGVVSNPLYANDTFNNIKNNLIELLSTLPKNDNKFYSQDELINKQDKLNTLKLSKENISNKLGELNTKLSHMERHRDNPDLSCPKCNHKFSLGYNETVYNNESSFRLKALNDLASTNKTILELEEYIKACNEYSLNIRQILQLMNNSPELNNYWSVIKDKELLYTDPSSLIIMLNDFSKDLLIQIDLLKIKETYNEKKELLDSLKEVGTSDLSTLVEMNNKLNTEIEQLSNKQIKVIADKKSYINRKQVLVDKDNLILKINSIIKEKKDTFKIELESIRRIYLNNLIMSLQRSLASKVEAMDGFKTHKNLINDINSQINNLTINELSLKELVSVLSPTDGLIAEGLTGFINSFVEQMNFFIKKIWAYPLIIQPCGFDTDNSVDLNYKFPVLVKNDDNLISDVSEGSTAMLDIINLAFRITAMQYLGFSHYPLGLDEWGSGFDVVHRNQAINAIKALSDQHIFDQLFIISHYAESFGALSNPEVCVLDITNIELPRSISVYNKHVVIE